MAYFDKPRFATDDAWRVGRLNTCLPGWLEANVAFIQSGGFNMSEERIKQVCIAQRHVVAEAQQCTQVSTPQWQPSICLGHPVGSLSPHRLQISQPVLLLWGEADEIIPPSLASKWQAALSKCKLVWVAQAGHSPHLERADFVSQQIIDFVADLADSAASSADPQELLQTVAEPALASAP
jgi:pimeloyl-ACP methyl ester carboxylesterase